MLDATLLAEGLGINLAFCEKWACYVTLVNDPDRPGYRAILINTQPIPQTTYEVAANRMDAELLQIFHELLKVQRDNGNAEWVDLDLTKNNMANEWQEEYPEKDFWFELRLDMLRCFILETGACCPNSFFITSRNT